MADISQSRVWFITGTSTGLGRALLEHVLAAGERVAATVRNLDALAPLVATYPSSQLLPLSVDVTSPAQIAAAFVQVKKSFGRLDVVVNNAGYGVEGEMEAVPDEVARQQVETLFWGPVNVTREALKAFREVNPSGHGGVFLNVSSIGGYAAQATLSFYNASKFALEGFTQSLSRELPPEWNIKCVIIEPGGFPTEWAGRGMVRFPPHPAYSADSPAVRMRAMRERATQRGDVARAAKAMFEVAGVEKPPLRLQLGSDAWSIAKLAAERTLRELEEWAEVSRATDAEESRVGFKLDMLKEAL